MSEILSMYMEEDVHYLRLARFVINFMPWCKELAEWVHVLRSGPVSAHFLHNPTFISFSFQPRYSEGFFRLVSLLRISTALELAVAILL